MTRIAQTTTANTRSRAAGGWANEAQMVSATVVWLQSLGIDACDASDAFLAMGRAPDVAAMCGDELWTIECKLRNWKQALRQAKDHQIVADKVFVMMPKEPPMADFNEAGIGIIIATPQNFVRKTEAKKSQITWQPARERYLSGLRQHLNWPNADIRHGG